MLEGSEFMALDSSGSVGHIAMIGTLDGSHSKISSPTLTSHLEYLGAQGSRT